MQVIKGLAIILIALFIVGCSKKDPKVIYQEVAMPVKCQVDIPIKPTNKKDFKSDKALMVYFLEVEKLLKHCVGADDGNK